MKEITIELTDYCPHNCKFCSSNTTQNREGAAFISVKQVQEALDRGDGLYDLIILSGGEPLAHPQFYPILLLCKARSRSVMVYTNALERIAYNAHVLDGIYVEAAITVSDAVHRVRLLKRVVQGRERTRPEVAFSRNFDGLCAECEHPVVKPTGELAQSPCHKEIVL